MRVLVFTIPLTASFTFGFAAGADLANRQLPKQITPEPGKITLFADYGSRRTNGSIPVYLINAGRKKSI